MKKVIGFIFTLALAFSFAGQASAAGAITPQEQTILDELTAGVTVNGTVYSAGASDLTQAENYLKANAVTDAQVSEVVKNIQGARALLAKQSITATSLADLYSKLSKADQAALREYVVAAATALNLKVTFANGVATFTDAAGSTIFKQASANGSNPIIKATGANYLVSGIVAAGLLALAVGAFVNTRKMNGQLAA